MRKQVRPELHDPCDASLNSKPTGDLYQQAANLFKIDKLFKEAGDAFVKEAECREKAGEKDEAANAYWNAAKSYKQQFPESEHRWAAPLNPS